MDRAPDGGIKLRCFLLRSDACYANEKYGIKFAPYKVSVLIDEPSFHAVMDITDDTSQKSKYLWSYCILKELNYSET